MYLSRNNGTTVTRARFLSSSELTGLASPDEYVSEIRDAYRQIGEGGPADPRTQLYTEDRSGSMTTYIAILPETSVMGGYVYSAGFGANDAWFMTPLFDAETGEPLALVDGSYMNPFKTGAVGAAGSDALSREDASVLSDVRSAPLFVDVEQGADDSADDADTGVFPTATFVIGDDRRRHVQSRRQVGLCDFEVRAPLAQRRSRVVAECDFTGNLLGEFLAWPPCHRQSRHTPAGKVYRRAIRQSTQYRHETEYQ